MENKIAELERRVQALENPRTLNKDLEDLLRKAGFFQLEQLYKTFESQNVDNYFLVFTAGHERYQVAVMNAGNMVQVAANPDNDTLNAPSHGFKNNDRVWILTTGTLPNPLESAVYNVVSATASSFKLALTPGGTPVNITTRGIGTLFARLFY